MGDGKEKPRLGKEGINFRRGRRKGRSVFEEVGEMGMQTKK